MKSPTLFRTRESKEKTARTTMTGLKTMLDDIKKINTLLAMHDAGGITYHIDKQYEVQFVLKCFIRGEEGDIITVMAYELYDFKKIMKQAKLHLKDIENGITVGD